MWASSTNLSQQWLNEHGISCTSCEVVKNLSNATAPRSCFLLKIDKAPVHLVLKQLPSDEAGVPLPERVSLSKRLGLAREAIFYAKFADSVPNVPIIYYAFGDMATGEKIVFMEDLSAWVDSGALFGKGNPNNAHRDLAHYLERAGNPTPKKVASVTFKAYAALHAKHWRDSKLLSHSWLRGADWTSGKSEETFEAAQKTARDLWAKGKEKPAWTFDPLVLEALEKAIAGQSWEAQRQRLNESTHWTLVHGDCWPGNVMWHPEGLVKFVDWEMAGVGSGPQDLGQYVISNMSPSDRRACEVELINDYYKELVKNGVADYSFDQCWREYTVGGVERWLWFLAYFAGLDHAGWAAFFHDQVLAFMKDHNLSAKDITQTRP